MGGKNEDKFMSENNYEKRFENICLIVNEMNFYYIFVIADAINK